MSDCSLLTLTLRGHVIRPKWSSRDGARSSDTWWTPFLGAAVGAIEGSQEEPGATRRHARLAARDLAGKVGTEPARFTTAAFEQLLSRPPTPDETAECVAFLRRQHDRHAAEPKPAGSADANGPAADPAVRACEHLVHVLMNHHDFVTVR